MTLLITNPPKITYLSSNRWEHGFPLSILNYPQLVSLFLASIRTPSPSFSSLEHHRQHQNVIRSHVFSLNKLRMHNFWYFLHNNIFFPMSNVEFIIVYFAKFAVFNNRGQAGEDWSECALFLPPCLLSASSSMGNQVKRVRQERSNGGSRQRRGREGVMRELALTCQCRGSRQRYHTLTVVGNDTIQCCHVSTLWETCNVPQFAAGLPPTHNCLKPHVFLVCLWARIFSREG